MRGRLPVPRSLPPLAETCAEFKGFHAGETRVDQVATILAAVIQRHRRSTPQAFYAMRDAADFFEVSLSTMATVYRRLDREGVLRLVRSSQSIVEARTPRPRFAIRGVVCMPIWLPGFLQFLDWRKWFSQLEEELARYHFVLEPVFYKHDEEGKPDFVDRMMRFNPDYVLWSWPNVVADLTTMNSIADAGVPLVIVQSDEQQFPGRAYHTNYERGLRQGLAEWEARGGLKEIAIPQHSSLRVRTIVRSSSLPCRRENDPPGNASTADLTRYLRRLAPDRRTGVIFGDDILYVKLCSVAPEAMTEFFRERRIMVLRQATIPAWKVFPLSNITVDALVYPWKKLARRIALDLSKARRSTMAQPLLLEAEWRPQIPLSTMVQTAFAE